MLIDGAIKRTCKNTHLFLNVDANIEKQRKNNQIPTTKIRASPPLIFGGEPRSPYPKSEGIYISHLSPSTMSCIASVQPLITWLGANAVGAPRP